MIDNLTNMIQVYKQQIDDDFQAEWSKKRFKWFFKKRRQRKLRSKIMSHYMHPIFYLVEDYIDDLLPKTINKSVEGFANIKDITYGEPNYFVKEN